MKETDDLDGRYGQIGIAAVAAATRFTAGAAILSRERARAEQVREMSVYSSLQLPDHGGSAVHLADAITD